MDKVTLALKEANLTHRDNEIFTYLLENKFATAEDIRLKFWEASPSKLHYRRLRILQKRGLIEVFARDSQNCSFLRLTTQGKKLLSKLGMNLREYGRVRALYLPPLEHETAVRQVRDTLQRSTLVSDFMPERRVKTLFGNRYGQQTAGQERYKVPDGIFSLRVGTVTVKIALEVELSLKSKKRYRNAFECLITSPSFDLVFFVAKDTAIRNKLMSHLKEVQIRSLALKHAKRVNNCYFAILSDVLSKKQFATFVSKSASFTLHELEQGKLVTDLVSLDLKNAQSRDDHCGGHLGGS